MPDATPTGPLSAAVDGLRTLIAAVPFFQTWTGTADSAHALARIFTGEVGYPIAAASVAGNMLTVQTREPHTIQAGDVVTIEGAATGPVSDLNIDGPQTVAAVTASAFTVAFVHDDVAVEYADQAFVGPAARPFAVISEDNEGVRSTVIGTGGTAIYAGSIDILIEADVSTAYRNDPRNARYEARNAFGQFIQGLSQTQGTGDFMVLNKIDPVSSPEFTSTAEQDDNRLRFERWRALLRVSWGLEG